MSSDPYIGPVKALIRRVHALWQSPSTTKDTPLFVYYDEHHTAREITDRLMTNYLRTIALSCAPGTAPTIGALRCTGATALLEGGVPLELIRLMGRWRSDEVFRYLHTQSEPLMAPLTDIMTTA